jgi:hypothetical protein
MKAITKKKTVLKSTMERRVKNTFQDAYLSGLSVAIIRLLHYSEDHKAIADIYLHYLIEAGESGYNPFNLVNGILYDDDDLAIQEKIKLVQKLIYSSGENNDLDEHKNVCNGIFEQYIYQRSR